MCSVELMMDVEHPKHVFHETKACCPLSELRDFIAASENCLYTGEYNEENKVCNAL